MTIVYVHRSDRWCALRGACPGGRVTTLCAEWQPYGPVLVCTDDPGDLLCRSCRAELAAGALGERGERDEDDGLGPDRDAIRDALLGTEHEDLLGDDVGAFDHLSDLRELDE